MANLRSAKKRVFSDDKKRLNNSYFKSDMRTQIKYVEKLINENNKEEALELLKTANKKIDKAIQKGAIHRNNGERHKSRLLNKVNGMGA